MHRRVYFIFLFIKIVLVNQIIIANEPLKMFTLENLVKNSNYIVKGRVISINSYIKENGRVYSDIEFLVSEVFKGKTQNGRTLYLTYYGGTINGQTTFIIEFPVFKVSEESILFLNKNKASNSIKIKYKVSGLNQGKFNLRKSSNKKYVIRDYSTKTGLLITKETGETKFHNNTSLLLSEFIFLIKMFL